MNARTNDTQAMPAEFPPIDGTGSKSVITRTGLRPSCNHFSLATLIMAFTLSPAFPFCPQSPDSRDTAMPTTSDHTDENPAPASESKRIFWVIPNYRTSPSLKDYKPLTPHEKYKIATEDSIDRGTLALAAAFAGQAQLADSERSFGQGVNGSARYFVTSYADWAIGNFMTEALYPTLLRQDPRYFRRSTGTGWSRFGYAVGQIFRTHSDSGRTQFNFSEIAGNSTAVAISSAYYPDTRDAQNAATKLGIQIGVDMASNILKEFWPDLNRKFGRKHRSTRTGGEPSL